jgi:hypothetical protein
VQVVTGGGNFGDCVPADLHSDSPPEAFLQRRAVQPRFARYIADAEAFATMHGRQYISNVTCLKVRSQSRVDGVEFVSLLKWERRPTS